MIKNRKNLIILTACILLFAGLSAYGSIKYNDYKNKQQEEVKKISEQQVQIDEQRKQIEELNTYKDEKLQKDTEEELVEEQAQKNAEATKEAERIAEAQKKEEVKRTSCQNRLVEYEKQADSHKDDLDDAMESAKTQENNCLKTNDNENAEEVCEGVRNAYEKTAKENYSVFEEVDNENMDNLKKECANYL